MFMNNQITAANMDFLLQNTGSTGTGNKKTETSLSFKEFLSSSYKAHDAIKVNTHKVEDQRAVNKPSAESDNAKAGWKSFRQLEKDTKLEARKALVQDKKGLSSEAESQVDDLSEDKKTSGKTKPELMVNCLAQILGISTVELESTLEAAGIKIEELASLDQVENRLQTVFGLDNETGAAFGRLLQVIDRRIEEAMALLNKEESVSGLDLSKLSELINNAAQTEVDAIVPSDAENAVTGPVELSDSILKLRLLLKEAGEKLEKDEAAFVEVIDNSVQKMLKDTTSLIKAAAIKAAADGRVNQEENLETLPAEESGSENTDSKEAKVVENSDEHTINQSPVKPEVPETAQNFANILNRVNVQDTNESLNVDRARMPVSERVILRQVIEKAKVVMTADKTEMAMELKPESLGKLSLKVVTENGIVMARFVAESQQVKQVLETNMQLLKDSLEKQGLNVQGFSVSVRQESQERQREFGHEGNGRTYGARTVFPGAKAYPDAAGIERLQSMNPYRPEESSINLTA